jgi:hypothetical protein
MPALKGTTVRRGGVTARYWYESISSVSINASSQINIGFSMDSKGGGQTQVQMEIGPEDFPTLLQMMSLVNRQAAMEAMSTELARQVQTQPERNIELARAARAEVHELATTKFMAKPYGEDEQERIVQTEVGKLIAEIEKPKS